MPMQNEKTNLLSQPSLSLSPFYYLVFSRLMAWAPHRLVACMIDQLLVGDSETT
jgi:hypothetical protein